MKEKTCFFPIVCGNKHINAAYKIILANESSELSGVHKISFPCSYIGRDQGDMKRKAGLEEEGEN